MIDIDNFKNFNDSYGHELGDKVLKIVVKTFQKIAGKKNHIIRWGGDEFVGVFPDCPKDRLSILVDSLVSSISVLEIRYGDEIIHVTVSMGASYFRREDSDYKEVLSRADKLLYESKKQGRNQGTVEKDLRP